MLSNNLICAPPPLPHPPLPPPSLFISTLCLTFQTVHLKAKADTQGLCYQGVWLRDELPHCK